MSKSKKKAIIKDSGYGNQLYRRTVRRAVNNSLRAQLLLEDLDELELKAIKTVINDYTRCDWIWDYENDPYHGNGKRVDEEELKTKRRK